VAFLSVGLKLLGDDSHIPQTIRPIVEREASLINAAQGVSDSPTMNRREDYSAYKIRGHYTADKDLERYFRAMMWFGRMSFRQASSAETAAGVLICRGLERSKGAYQAWDEIDEQLRYFVGDTDDLSCTDYIPLAKKTFGDALEPGQILDPAKMQAFMQLASALREPRINSSYLPPMEWKRVVQETKGLRLLGQRYTVTGDLFQNVLLEQGRLPSGLDVMTSLLGSLTARDALEAEGKHPIAFAPSRGVMAKSSHYARLLQSLALLLRRPQQDAPRFMRSEKWGAKQLNAAMGGWAELAHDTLLHSKMAMRTLGGSAALSDLKGYVEPVPEYYRELGAIVRQTREFLEQHGIFDKTGTGINVQAEMRAAEKQYRNPASAPPPSAKREHYVDLENLLGQLAAISEKELKKLPLDREDNRVIEDFGRRLRYLAFNITTSEAHEDMSVIADVAGEYQSGQVLEVGVGRALPIYVLAPSIYGPIICQGGIFSYYEFPRPINNRLNDQEWRALLDSKASGYYPWLLDKGIGLERRQATAADLSILAEKGPLHLVSGGPNDPASALADYCRDLVGRFYAVDIGPQNIPFLQRVYEDETVAQPSRVFALAKLADFKDDRLRPVFLEGLHKCSGEILGNPEFLVGYYSAKGFSPLARDGDWDDLMQTFKRLAAQDTWAQSSWLGASTRHGQILGQIANALFRLDKKRAWEDLSGLLSDPKCYVHAFLQLVHGDEPKAVRDLERGIAQGLISKEHAAIALGNIGTETAALRMKNLFNGCDFLCKKAILDGLLLRRWPDEFMPRYPNITIEEIRKLYPEALSGIEQCGRGDSQKAIWVIQVAGKIKAESAAEELLRLYLSGDSGQSPFPEVRRVIPAALADLGYKRALPAIKAQYERSQLKQPADSGERCALVLAMAQLGDAEALSTIDSWLRGNASEVRYCNVLEGTVAMKTAASARLLSGLLINRPAEWDDKQRHSFAEEHILRGLDIQLLDKATRARLVENAAQRLGHKHGYIYSHWLPLVGEDAAPLLSKRLDQPGDKDDKGVIMETLASIGNEQAYEAVKRQLASPDVDMRKGACNIIGRFGAWQGDSIDLVGTLLGDQDKGVRGAAAWALHQYFGPAGDAKLMQALRGEDGSSKFSAIWALCANKVEEGIEAAFNIVAKGPKDVQVEAASCLLHQAPAKMEERVVGALAGLYDRSSDQMKIQILSLLERRYRYTSSGQLEEINNSKLMGLLDKALASGAPAVAQKAKEIREKEESIKKRRQEMSVRRQRH
jgi:HEAT repeat protein